VYFRAWKRTYLNRLSLRHMTSRPFVRLANGHHDHRLARFVDQALANLAHGKHRDAFNR
jgi:hypothetical protein